jgi:hypothetical protein
MSEGTAIILTGPPSLKPDGGKAYSTRGQLFDGRVGDRFVVKRSTTPFCDAARVLLADGTDLATSSSCGTRGRLTTRCARP